MIKITTEDIISSLLALRFQKIDKLLYFMTLSKLTLMEEDESLFDFVDVEYSDYFNTYVDSDDFNFKLKEGYRLSSDDIDGYTIYSKLRNKNKRLTDYLETLDFKDIIIHKMKIISTNYRECDYKDLFCDKEKEIIADIFGIKQMYRGYTENPRKIHTSMYEQKVEDNKKINNVLRRIREK